MPTSSHQERLAFATYQEILTYIASPDLGHCLGLNHATHERLIRELNIRIRAKLNSVLLQIGKNRRWLILDEEDGWNRTDAIAGNLIKVRPYALIRMPERPGVETGKTLFDRLPLAV